jgi:hypothetical protein
MNIPLDNLYHWVRGCVDTPLSIYIFKPHGSKNITDLTLMRYEDLVAVFPELVCHDQEPLDYKKYQGVKFIDLWTHVKNLEGHHKNFNYNQFDAEMQVLAPYYDDLNFYAMLRVLKFQSIFDRYILLHSEKNSSDVEKFLSTAEPVYYWSHAIIARDWYRFAEHDLRLQQNPTSQQTFLIYCRAWTGTREYRLKFLDLLVDENLLHQCQTSIMKQDQEFEIASYVCSDSKLQPNNIKSLIEMSDNITLSHASADYCTEDFVLTDISIVLETVAADTKIHLTEKTLRPIACGHPFMLVAGPGSLEYLRSYGFKTFSPWIDESYDQEQNIVKRMQLIVKEMSRISNLPVFQKNYTIKQLKKIAKHNKNHFFSNSFFNQIQTELVENLNQAISKIKFTRGTRFLTTRKVSKRYRKLRNQPISIILRKLRQNPGLDLNQLISQLPIDLFNF